MKTYIALLTFLFLILSNFYVASNPNTFSNALISYYPIKQGNLSNALNATNSLTYDSEINQQSDRLGRQNEAIHINNKLKWDGNQFVNITEGITIFFRWQEDLYSDESYTLVDIDYISGNQTSSFGMGNGRNSNSSEIVWRSIAIQVQKISSSQFMFKTHIDARYNGGQYRNYTGDIYITSLQMGRYNMSSLFVIDDVAFFDRQLSDEEITQLHNLSQDIIEPQPPGPVADQCEENLKNLYSKNVTVDYQFIDPEHIYEIDFGGFNFLDNCYEATLNLNGNNIGLGYYSNKTSVKYYIPKNYAVPSGCVQNTEYELECHFKLEIKYQGDVQMTKNFTSIMTTTNLDDIQNGLQLSVISDHSDQIRTIGSSVETEVNICTDATCLEYSTTGQIIRNEISFIELKINTPQYQSFFPVHKSLKLDNKEFLPENLQEIQNWNQAGRIIYQIKPHIASDNLYLLIQIGLVETLPTTRRMRRFLQQEQQSIEIQDELGANDQDLVGKQIVINIIDKSDSKEDDSESSNTGLILGVTLGSVAFVSFSVSVVAFTILKMKKLALLAEAAKIAPVPNSQIVDAVKIDPSFPKTNRPLQGLPENV